LDLEHCFDAANDGILYSIQYLAFPSARACPVLFIRLLHSARRHLGVSAGGQHGAYPHAHPEKIQWSGECSQSIFDAPASHALHVMFETGLPCARCPCKPLPFCHCCGTPCRCKAMCSQSDALASGSLETLFTGSSPILKSRYFMIAFLPTSLPILLLLKTIFPRVSSEMMQTLARNKMNPSNY
jgi:hypothetical protein